MRRASQYYVHSPWGRRQGCHYHTHYRPSIRFDPFDIRHSTLDCGNSISPARKKMISIRQQ
ncbi:hypothetical protein M5D96_013532 [Drosophila gunungcola]|uniref:Uncharacterized protein n=1 Tax=Drosophila gunungcola TaxID=103775 RepID=A0A9Q0BJH5_9MUSC|nr:hypothetical protein M5D96_013532 [Drosophila gunungcola]